jgi:hypothetical protein
MPVSVVVAASALSLMMSARVAQLALAFDAGTPAGRLMTGFMQLGIGGLILAGLLLRNRLAWQWGRVAAVLGFVALGFVLWAYVSRMAPWDTLPVVLILAQLVPVAAIFFALGTESAREHFRLRCPQCSAFTSRAANFLFTKAVCDTCNTTW